MKKNFFIILKNSFWFFMLFLTTQGLNAQVGINTTTPAASSVLDVTSTTQGMLTPRMTTAQKLAITSPANGLMVFDTTLKGFSYYDGVASLWVNLAAGRVNFKRIKGTDVLATVLASELLAGGGSKYLLDSSTLYEINGTVVVDFPIEINNAYLTGLDTNEDKLIRSTGDLFVGTTGGSVKLLTMVASGVGGNVFNINGGGTQILIFRDSVIASSTNVGVLQSFNMIFSSIVQYSGNTNGIIYRNITKLLLDSQGWFGNNSGTYEKYEGTFGSLQKQGGFTEVIGAKIGFDVSANPVVSQDGTMTGVNFTGAPTGSGEYVKKYTSGTYPGFSFTNKWDVNCSGIPFEGDSYTVGDVNMDYAIGSGITTTLSGSATKVLGTTTSNNMYRASVGGTNNRVQYLGNKKRFFTVNAVGSFQATNSANTTYVFYIVKNGTTIINQSKTYAFSTNNIDIRTFPIQCIIEMNPNDYIEVWAQRYNGSSDMFTVSLNLFMK